jgi:hypothetical protein
VHRPPIAMKEKLNEYPIDHPVDAAAREKIDQFIDANAAKFGRNIAKQWDASGNILHLASQPVECELQFHDTRVETFASIPFLLKMFMTDENRKKIDEAVTDMLTDAGLIKPT